MSGIIKNKDQKILWARAAGRCSIPDCRRKLTLEKDDESESITLGEMCHIVGEKDSEDSPRGISKLPLDERNNYSNLILLCSHHHKIIDKDESAWPVEILHKIKDEHELWVEESLSQTVQTPELIVYSDIIDGINSVLQLDKWDWFISNAVRNIFHKDFINAQYYINERLLAIDWPKSNLELENTIKSMMESYSELIEYFLKYAAPTERGDFYREDTFYKRIFPNPDYHVILERNKIWYRKSHVLLCLFVFRLNDFVKKVRENFNPIFHLKRGKFLIIDELGTFNGGESCLALPDLDNTLKLLEELNKEQEAFERKNKNWR